jgi:CheY-like chemotaxis protein
MKKVLLIEDNRVLRELFKSVLAREYCVVAVASGQEALEALRTGTFDLVLSDFDLPDMTGADVYRLQGGDRPLWLAVSGSEAEPEFQDWVERERVPYLTKPCSPGRLMSFVRDCLSSAGSRAATVPA